MTIRASAAITLTCVVDVYSTTRYYLLQSSTLNPPARPTARPPAGAWDDTEPGYVQGSTNTLYFTDLTVFSDGTWAYSAVSASSAYEAAKAAYNQAISAQSTAQEARQAVDDMDIGGRNLLLQSDGVRTATVSAGGTIANSNYFYLSEYGAALAVEGAEFTFSMDYEVDTQTTVKGLIYTQLNGSATAPTGLYIVPDVAAAPSGRAYITFRVTAAQAAYDGSFRMRLRFYDANEGASFKAWNLKLEKGNRPTDWTPAPEDVDAAIEGVGAAVVALDESLNQQAIFNRLTDNGAAQGMVLYEGQLYVNASYLKSGTIDGGLVNVKLLNIVDADGHVIAAFRDVITLGEGGNARAEMDFNSLALIDKEDNPFFSAGDLRDSSGVATVSEAFTGTGAQTDFYVRNRVKAVRGVTVNGAAVTAYTRYEKRFIFAAAPADGAAVVIRYTTEDAVYHYTLGTRSEDALVGNGSVAAGLNVAASRYCSHAEGLETEATGECGHAEGYQSAAGGRASHAEGYQNTASGEDSHAEGNGNAATGRRSHAEGGQNLVSGTDAHAEGLLNEASGDCAHAEGYHTVAAGFAQHVSGKFNEEDSDGEYAEIVGNGSHIGGRSNARTLDWSGNAWIAGALDVGNAAATRENLDVYSRAEADSRVIIPSAGFAIPAAGASVFWLMPGMTAGHMLVRWNFSDSPENAPPTDLAWQTYDGFFRISNTGVPTAESIRPVFALPAEIDLRPVN